MTTPDVPPIALAGEPPICDVIDVLFSQKAAWTSELGYAINSSDFRHLLEKTGGIHAPTPSASSVPVAMLQELRDDCERESKKTDCYTCYTEQAAYMVRRIDVILAAPPANQAPSVLTDERIALQDLVAALDAAFISTWQTTAEWQNELDHARALLQANGATK